MLTGGPSGGVEVGERVELRKGARVVLIHHVHLHLAEASREGDLGGGRQVLVSEQQQLMLQESGVDGGEARIIDRGDLQVENFRPDATLEWTQPQCCGGRSGRLARELHGCSADARGLKTSRRAESG